MRSFWRAPEQIKPKFAVLLKRKAIICSSHWIRFAKPMRLTKPAKTPCPKPLSPFWRVVTLKMQYAVRFPSAATAIRWRQLRAGLPKRFTVYRSTSRKKHFPICPRICGKLPRIFTARLQNKKHRGRFYVPSVFFVICKDYFGSRTVKVLPSPSVLSTETELPVNWQAVCTSASPSPLPTARCEASP